MGYESIEQGSNRRRMIMGAESENTGRGEKSLHSKQNQPPKRGRGFTNQFFRWRQTGSKPPTDLLNLDLRASGADPCICSVGFLDRPVWNYRVVGKKTIFVARLRAAVQLEIGQEAPTLLCRLRPDYPMPCFNWEFD